MEHEMRKKKQEIIGREEIDEIINSAEVCRLAMCRGSIPYVIPMNFGYDNGCLYFHCASNGLKIDILRENPNFCFEFESDVNLITNETPCDWSQFYRSVIGWGQASFLSTHEEKLEALLILMNQYEKRDWKIPDSKVDTITIFKVVIDKITGKKDGNEPNKE